MESLIALGTFSLGLIAMLLFTCFMYSLVDFEIYLPHRLPPDGWAFALGVFGLSFWIFDSLTAMLVACVAFTIAFFVAGEVL